MPAHMGAPLPRWSNTAIRLALVALVLALVGIPALLMAYVRSPYVTNEGNPPGQPVMFDHRHHVRDDGLDCRYCHASVETAATAGIPATEVCLNCHSQLWTSSPLLAPVRESARTGTPIPWKRVHVLPDFVFFDHSVHVSQGVGCVECHGRVDLMAGVEKAQPLTMGWCLDCHRNPAPHLRPHEFITSMDWNPPDRERLGAALEKSQHVRHLDHCSACHR